MLKKCITLLLITISLSSLTTACTKSKNTTETIRDMIAGKTYVYEKEGFGGDFTITIEEDGDFSYYEGALSSYIGIGTWSLDGDILCLSVEENQVISCGINYFRVKDDTLIFLAEDSGNFSYIKVADGEKFTWRQE